MNNVIEPLAGTAEAVPALPLLSPLPPAGAAESSSPAPAALPSPARRGRYSRYSPERLKKRLSRLEFKAIDCLEEILADSSAKAADRISAAKLSFDVAQRQSASEPASDGVVRVIFEGSPVEYAE